VIHGFAGDDIERAVVHDEAAALLSDYDQTVQHFDIVLDEARTGDDPSTRFTTPGSSKWRR
jgi:hypothetical protein